MTTATTNTSASTSTQKKGHPGKRYRRHDNGGGKWTFTPQNYVKLG